MDTVAKKTVLIKVNQPIESDQDAEHPHAFTAGPLNIQHPLEGQDVLPAQQFLPNRLSTLAEQRCKIIEVACWAHARWNHFNARKFYPSEAHQVPEWIVQPNHPEDRTRELSANSRCKMRRAKAANKRDCRRRH